MRQFTYVLAGIGLLTLAACARHEYHYWQKTDPNTALYLTGVKAQQMLEQDIAFCVHQIIELSKLADVRGQVPAPFQPTGSYDQKQAHDDMNRLPYWDVPEYIRDLRVDHTDFHDFDGCMAYKGWQRVKYVAPDAERRAKHVYDDTANYSVRPKNPAKEAASREENALNRDRPR
jgi:hypothetical protein